MSKGQTGSTLPARAASAHGAREPESFGGLRIGCAGWTIPRQAVAAFPGPGSHLERYARVLPAVEINSTFYRPHRPDTFARWSAAVPERFRFAVKLARQIAHARCLRDCEEPLAVFLEPLRGLGSKLGPLLVQLPPSLAFEPERALAFFEELRARHDGAVACEPRHASWFEQEAEALLARVQVARVAADPARVPTASRPGGFAGLVYFRLHGSPRMYYSGYGGAVLRELAPRLREAARHAEVYCIFDNAAAGAATANAPALADLVAEP